MKMANEPEFYEVHLIIFFLSFNQDTFNSVNSLSDIEKLI